MGAGAHACIRVGVQVCAREGIMRAGGGQLCGQELLLGIEGHRAGCGGVQGQPSWGSDSQEGQGCPSCGKSWCPSTASSLGTRPPSVQAGVSSTPALAMGHSPSSSSLIGEGFGQGIPQSSARFSLMSLVTATREY